MINNIYYSQLLFTFALLTIIIMDSLLFSVTTLPKELGHEIFSFIVPDISTITFEDFIYYRYIDRHSDRYKTVHVNKTVLYNTKSEDIQYLSVIEKKNKKHRYYLTTLIEYRYCRGCGVLGCSSMMCRGTWDYEYEYKTVFIGKDLLTSLIRLLL